MPMIIGINPVRKRKTKTKTKTKKRTVAKRVRATAKTKKTAPKSGAKRKGTVMARKKRKAPKTRTITKTKVVYRSKPKRNPRRNRKLGTKNPDTKMTLKKILRGSVAAAAGMLIAKAAVNKLTAGGSETERWSWTNIGVAGVSSVAVALIAKQVLSLKQPTVFFIAAGGVALMFYKIFTTKIAPRWGWSESWFGADSDINPALLGAGNEDYLLSDDIDVIDDSGMGMLPGQSDMMGASDSGGQVVNFNPAMGYTESGGQVVPFNPAMGAVDTAFQEISRRAEEAYPG